MTARPRVFVAGFAAEPVAEGTRFAHLEAYCVPGPEWFRTAACRLLATRIDALRRHVRRDVDGIEAALHGARG